MDAIGNQRGAELYEACRPRAFRKPDEWADDRCPHPVADFVCGDL